MNSINERVPKMAHASILNKLRMNAADFPIIGVGTSLILSEICSLAIDKLKAMSLSKGASFCAFSK